MPSSDTYFREGNEAAVKHGVRSYQATGELPESRKTPALVARQQELREHLATPEGLQQEQEHIAECAVMALDLALSYVLEQREEGVSLGEIKVYAKLPAFLNSAGRQVSRLFEMQDKLGKVGATAVDYDELVRQLEREQ